MGMQELKDLIYQGEKVDIECKKAESNVPKSAYESYSAFANTRVAILFWVSKKIRQKQTRKKDLCCRHRESREAKRGFLEHHQRKQG